MRAFLFILFLSLHFCGIAPSWADESHGAFSNASSNESPLEADYSKIEFKEPESAIAKAECHLCHLKKNKLYFKKAQKTELRHDELSPEHGKKVMSCNSCHDINNHNFLLSSKEFPADFKNPSGVCGHCHRDQYRDWRRGMHGKRLGGWIQPKLQYHCTECHHPHRVKFQKMEALPGRPQPPNVIPKHHESTGGEH